MTLTNYIGAVPDAGQPTIARIQNSGLLDKLGGVLTNGKEKLRVAGQMVRENLDLILVGSMHVFTTAIVPAILLEASHNPGRAIAPETGYLMFPVMAFASGVMYVPMYYQRFKTGRHIGT